MKYVPKPKSKRGKSQIIKGLVILRAVREFTGNLNKERVMDGSGKMLT